MINSLMTRLLVLYSLFSFLLLLHLSFLILIDKKEQTKIVKTKKKFKQN